MSGLVGKGVMTVALGVQMPPESKRISGCRHTNYSIYYRVPHDLLKKNHTLSHDWNLFESTYPLRSTKTCAFTTVELKILRSYYFVSRSSAFSSGPAPLFNQKTLSLGDKMILASF